MWFAKGVFDDTDLGTAPVNKKREIRRLWITRINAGARQNGMSYSQFMNGLKRAEIDLNRKVLSDIVAIPAGRFASCLDTEGNSIGVFSR